MRYVICNEIFTEYVKAIHTGTSIPHISKSQIENFAICYPPLNEQIAIGLLLQSLDDRIALLRETNATLESIAQAIFKSWFIDFDPVKAKQQGIAPQGIDPETAALFPDTFQDSELGLIPEGWKVGIIENLCDAITNGGTPSRSKQVYWDNGSIPWYKTGELSDGFLLSSSELITDEGLINSNVKLLPENAILMAIYAAPTVGRLGVLTKPSTFNQACTGMVAKKSVGSWFLYLNLFFGRDWFNSRANGAAQQNVSKAIVSSYKIILPSSGILQAFHDLADKIFFKIRTNHENAQILTSIRDTLLPRLISGRLLLTQDII